MQQSFRLNAIQLNLLYVRAGVLFALRTTGIRSTRLLHNILSTDVIELIFK